VAYLSVLLYACAPAAAVGTRFQRHAAHRVSQHAKTGRTVADMWEDAADAWAHKVAVIFHGHSFTFADMECAANRIANWAGGSMQLSQGDTIAVLVNNRPEFIALWAGCAKLGVKCAFINTALTGSRLLHCISIVSPKMLVYESALHDAVAEVAVDTASVLPGIRFAVLPIAGADTTEVSLGAGAAAGSGSSVPLHTLPQRLPVVDMGTAVAAASDKRPSYLLRTGVGPGDTFGYIYSSGTTGMNKACEVQHSKLMLGGLAFSQMFGIVGSDVLYEVLPLFHSAAGIIAQSLMMTVGLTLALREKFSMSRFWDDVATSGATVFQYIGELCRYLTNAPPHALERKHRLRLAFGNGLRPDVWPKFVGRFGVGQIGEFYAATEGNVQLFNLNNTPAAALRLEADGALRLRSWPGMGAVGRMGLFANSIRKFPIVRFDMNSEDVVRDRATGLCIPADADEAGEMLGVVSSSDPTTEFKGYAGGDASGANDKKLLRNVFGRDDLYFRTGDLLRRDAAGYIFFSDRIGDTFRWHGENVATTEVAEVVSAVRGVQEVNVYGVEVPGHDGRAGCAAITPTGDVKLDDTTIASSQHAQGAALELQDVARAALQSLPKYALPLFVRLLPAQPVTSTFKHQKVALRNDGVDPTLVSDPVFILDTRAKAYVSLTAQMWGDIMTGAAKL